ncbi:MAG: HAMP domain-containing sensor histidine kinase [Solirubrobacteraceae bacterium]
MASLRARLILTVLMMAALGLAALAIVTYAEQRSFLLGRLDQQARTAVPAVERSLSDHGFGRARLRDPARPAGTPEPPQADRGPVGDGGPTPDLPPGTYGERRTAAGATLGHVLISLGQSAAPPPAIGKQPPLGRVFTARAVSGEERYRAYARADPFDGGLTIVALPLREADQTLAKLVEVEALVIAGVLLALGVAAMIVVRLGLRPLDRMERTAGEIAAGELSRRVSPATPRTEVGRLGLALNGMLERLEQAFEARQQSEDRLRRFLADASHELRTPLASIRGYAELFRMGASTDAEGTRRAMRRIAEESRRMGLLVDDLLTLARLDEARALAREPVDLAALARDAVHDARASAPDRTISLSAPEDAIALGDADRLAQVLANLLRNTLVHTPPGSPVEVAVAPEGDRWAVEVRDHGPGLPEVEARKLFERFWRAEGGRERGRGGAGLGLAIVSEIVEAHGGSVSAANAPGGGAAMRFTLAAA